MADIYIRGKDGRPQLVGKTADPQLPGRVTALEERVDAIEAAPGGVQLSDAVDSDSSTTAASSKAVKTVWDKANSAAATANAAQSAATAAKTAADTAQDTAEAAFKKAEAASKEYITEQWHSEGLWYRKWSDGFIEQGGYVRFDASIVMVTLSVPFTDYRYNVVASKLMGGQVEGYAPEQGPIALAARNPSYFKAGTGVAWESDKYVMWYASGY